jgi:Mg2+ and Co2+ transporter CorA
MIAGGLWGMNVAVPWADDKYAFFEILLITALVTFATERYFRRKNWI